MGKDINFATFLYFGVRGVKLSPLLREKLKRDPPQLVRCVIEVTPQRVDYILSQLQEMGIRVDRRLISQPVPEGNFYIPAVIPANLLDEVQRIPGVVSISKSMIRAAGGAVTTPIPNPFARIQDELLGEIRIPSVEVPMTAILSAPPNPFDVPKAIGALMSKLTGFNPTTNIWAFTTERAYQIMKDVPSKNEGAGVKVAVLDTGSNRFTFQAIGDAIEEYTVIPEPPQDFHSHGSHCSNTVYGRYWTTIYGPVIGGAPFAQKMHVKCLNTFPGSGTTEGILKAIEIAVKNGARVLSMSLGGPAQGNGVDEDPEAKVVNELAKQGVLFVIAAGNSGSDLYTVGSPGCAIKALTVGSASIMDNFQPAWWSSRGPGSDWDGQHTEDFMTLLRRYGDEIIKPDCTGLGGGRASQDAQPDEVQCSLATGWFEGFYDGIKGDQACLLHGTSQATPTVAGLVACLLSDGVIDNVDDVKRALRETATDYIVPDPINTELDKRIIDAYGKSIATGWGLFRLSRFKR